MTLGKKIGIDYIEKYEFFPDTLKAGWAQQQTWLKI
jgi:hypothetical protein